MSVFAALFAASGTYLLYSAIVLGKRSLRPSNVARAARRRGRLSDWIVQAGMVDVRPAQFVVVEAAMLLGVTGSAWLVFGAPLPSFLAGCFGALVPLTVYRSRRRKLLDEARDAWPYLIEEIRLLTGALGRSIPVAVIEAGRKAPTAPMRAAFDAANREWLLSTDFGRATNVLKAGLADPTADVVCETLLVAHEIGGSDLERRLAALVDDRRTDLRHRNEARARQAGPRFARWFVLGVPLGMALAGLSIGDGRAAYRTPGGQVAVALAMAMVAGCWVWASRIMRLPEVERVFEE